MRNRPPARLVARRAGAVVARFDLDRPDLTLGRGRDGDLALPSPLASRRHSRIRLLGGCFWIFDLGSSSGTWVNGRAIRSGTRLEHGDRIVCGDVELVYEEHEAGS